VESKVTSRRAGGVVPIERLKVQLTNQSLGTGRAYRMTSPKEDIANALPRSSLLPHHQHQSGQLYKQPNIDTWPRRSTRACNA